jgi:LAO/AO transport system kinase
MKKTPELSDFIEGIRNRDRTLLARAITLVESQNSAHQVTAQKLLQHILPLTGKSKRLGISGTPGVGKSTFIEAFGKMLTSSGKTVAVLAVDPTSQKSGGSILGDKTRMNELAIDEKAFIRPSPSGETLGGVARRTRESLLLCEAFGFDYVLVETVGVGQSETTVASMVDIFIMLLQPGAGDDLQGIKRGILELVDMVVVTKDDGEQKNIIAKAKHDYQQALHILRHEGWQPPVLSCSSMTKSGLPEIQQSIDQFFKAHERSLQSKRMKQGQEWAHALILEGLEKDFLKNIGDAELRAAMSSISKGDQTPPQVAETLLRKYFQGQQS